MGALAFLIFLLFAGTILWVLGSAIYRRLNRWNRAYDGVNRRLNGQLYQGFLVNTPRLWFNYGPFAVRLQNRRGWTGGAGRTTELAVRWPEKRSLRFEILASDPRREMELDGEPTGRGRAWQAMTTGDADFDRRFVYWANRPDELHELLTQPVRSHLRQLAEIHQPSLLVGMKRGILAFRKQGWMATVDQLDDFLRWGLETFDRMRLARCEGVEFRDEESAAIVEEAICPICTEKIKGRMVVCYRCKTPHCADCWEYNGQCATYGCSERRCLSV